jgi:hypothetical protein
LGHIQRRYLAQKGFIKMKISHFIRSAAIASTIASAAAIISPIAASAATFNFSNIAGGDTVGDSLAQYLSMDVTASGSGTLFKFNFATNPTAFTSAFIGTVYIDAGTTPLGTNASITVDSGNVGTVDFTGGTGTSNLPQSGNLATAFTTDYAFDNVNGSGNSKAVQEGESLGVLFSTANFNNVIAGINAGTLRVGYHVQGIGSGSDSYINSTGTPTPVPVPAFLFGVVAAGAFGGTRLLKNKKQAV